eukprot:TRINITY_DN19312_c0_g1_i1.p1 TRINITY_DN19312_c0_g1~~TRINITY_DN19312_c0_g1_i1.p1  ORF type:complete len:673 (+),score=159.59 TRINITY_DN19312_c0_g1_i1:60-2021(+)
MSNFLVSGKHQTVELAGRDRFKFFKRPVVPLVDQANTASNSMIVPQVPLQTKPHIGRPLPTLEESKPKQKRKIKQAFASTAGSTLNNTNEGTVVNMEGTCDVMCQTDYREMDCQTDPYTPDYFVEEGVQPQVLALMEIKWGAGLPAGVAEVEMIDRVKRRTQVESGLPQGGDDEAMTNRLNALEDLEQIEWNERELHIKQLQDERRGQMAVALEKRELKRESINQQRIEMVKQQKLDEAERKLNRLQERRMLATRKLTAHHTNPSKEAVKKDIIQSYSVHGKRGKQVESNSLVEKMTNTNYDVRPTLLGFPEGVQELERTKAPQIERIKVKDTKPPEDPAITSLENNFRKRAAKKVVEHLHFAQQTIDKAKAGTEAQTSIQDFYRATPRLVRPDTPTLVLQGDQDEEREEALVLVQRLLRGRAVQNEFFEGKERCHGLIEELQAASRAKETESEWKERKAVDAYAIKQQQMVDGVIDQIQGDILHGTLDYLMKELTRQREIAKFDELRRNAELTRKTREEAEIKRRKEEELQRKREDHQYHLLVDAIDYTASTFLEQTFDMSLRATAYEQAVSEQLESIKETEPTPQQLSEIEEEILVCDIMDTFVIPQVELEQKKKKGDQAISERARAQEASSSIYGALKDVIDAVPKDAWK